MITFRDAQEAFTDAIAKGVLSTNPLAPNYAGNYMYMHTELGADAFKHVDTRRYLKSHVPLHKTIAAVRS